MIVDVLNSRSANLTSLDLMQLDPLASQLLLYKLPCVIPGNGHHRSVHCQLLQCERGLKLALISALALAISQLIFVHDPCVVVLMFESSLRVKLSLASIDEGAGAKILRSDRRNTPEQAV
jgi:hypothetical protein